MKETHLRLGLEQVDLKFANEEREKTEEGIWRGPRNLEVMKF